MQQLHGQLNRQGWQEQLAILYGLMLYTCGLPFQTTVVSKESWSLLVEPLRLKSCTVNVIDTHAT